MKITYESFLQKGIVVLIFLAFLTPLIISPFGAFFISVYPKTLFFRLIVEIAFLLYIFLLFKNKNYLPKFSFVSLFISLYFFISLISSVFGFNLGRSFWGNMERWEGLILQLHLLLFFFIMTAVLRQKHWVGIFKFAVCVSAGVSISGILQKISFFKFLNRVDNLRISGTILNPDFFGAYVVLAFFLCLFVLFKEKNRVFKIFWSTILILNFYALILSGTRAAWVGFSLGLVSILFFSLKNYGKQRIKIFVLFFALLLSVLFLILIKDKVSSGDQIFDRAISVFDVRSLNNRLKVWSMALEAWRDRPVLGWGFESYGFLFEKYFRASYLNYFSEYSYFDHPHNKFLEILTESGVIGLASFLGIFLAAFYSLFKYSRITDDRSKQKIFKAFSAAFLIGYLVPNFFSFDTIDTYLLLFLFLGFISSNYQKKGNKEESIGKKEREAGGKIYYIVLIFLVILMGVFSYEINWKPHRPIALLDRGTTLEKNDINKVISNCRQAISANTVFKRDTEILVAKILISSFDSEKNKSNKANIISMLFVVRSALRENIGKPNRWFLQPHYLIAEIDRRAYLFSKDKNLLQEIEEVSNLALAFNNQQARFYRLLGEKNILEGNYQNGEDFYNKSFEMTAKSPEDEVSLYKNIGAAYSETGDKERSAENMMKAFGRYYSWRKRDPIPPSEIFSDKIRNDVVFWGKLIFLYHNDLKKEETAREIYKKSIEIFPEYKNVFITVFGKMFQEE